MHSTKVSSYISNWWLIILELAMKFISHIFLSKKLKINWEKGFLSNSISVSKHNWVAFFQCNPLERMQWTFYSIGIMKSSWENLFEAFLYESFRETVKGFWIIFSLSAIPFRKENYLKKKIWKNISVIFPMFKTQQISLF